MPEISVLLNNFNYGEFVGEAIQSVLSQDFKDFELILVDDGSTDGSRTEIERWKDSRIRKIFQKNGGQLSAIHAGFQISRGRILCFLDSDDLYSPGYLAAVARCFRNNADCGFLLAEMEYFGTKKGQMPFPFPEGRLGGRAFSVAVLHQWFGVPTSGCSIRRTLAERFLPWFEGEAEWKLRADDLLIWGSEIAGGIKYHIANPPIRYRVHSRNGFCGTPKLSPEKWRNRCRSAAEFSEMVMRKNRLNWLDLLENENRNGGILPDKRLLALLKLGRERMISGKDFSRALFSLLRDCFRKPPRLFSGKESAANHV